MNNLRTLKFLYHNDKLDQNIDQVFTLRKILELNPSLKVVELNANVVNEPVANRLFQFNSLHRLTCISHSELEFLSLSLFSGTFNSLNYLCINFSWIDLDYLRNMLDACPDLIQLDLNDFDLDKGEVNKLATILNLFPKLTKLGINYDYDILGDDRYNGYTWENGDIAIDYIKQFTIFHTCGFDFSLDYFKNWKNLKKISIDKDFDWWNNFIDELPIDNNWKLINYDKTAHFYKNNQ